MNNPNVLTVVSVSNVKKDKNKRSFKTIKVRTSDKKSFINDDGVKVTAKIQPKIGTINSWEESYLDGNQEFTYEFAEGEVILGDVVTLQVEPYEIPNQQTGEIRTVNRFSCVVLGDSTAPSWNSDVAKVFASNDKVVDINLVGTANVNVASPFEG